MGDGTKEKPYTRKDVVKAIEENGGDARRLVLSDKWFEAGINLQNLPLEGINLQNGIFPAHIEGSRSIGARFDGSSMLGANLRNASLRDASFGMYGSKPTAMQGVDLIGAHLENAQFQEADLTGAQFQGIPLPLTESQKAQYVVALWEALPAYLENTDFRGANLFLANFKGCYFYGTKLQGAHIRGADIFEGHLEDADWGNYKIGEEIKKEELYFAESTYRRLKQWYTNAGHYDIAGEFFFREMTVRRKALKWWPNPLNRAVPKLISMLCGYGERPGNVLIWAIMVIFGLAIAYGYGGLDVLHSIYFSLVSFTALGYGSWVPDTTGWIKALGAFESFIGVFTIALFLVTFVRKWTR